MTARPLPSTTPTSPSPTTRGRGIRDLWPAIASRQVIFAHQSVGAQVVAGVEQLSVEHGLELRIVQTARLDAVVAPAFVHFLAGRNEDPASKNAALLDALDSRPTADEAIVILKYCYVDINHRTDPYRLADAYRATVAEIRARHPDVTLVHSTIPLTTVEGWTKAAVKRVLRRPRARDAGINRHRYNALIRTMFAGETIFDVAAAEATRADGTRSVFHSRGQRVQTLAEENSTDGGHLNGGGRRIVAAALLDAITTAIVARP